MSKSILLSTGICDSCKILLDFLAQPAMMSLENKRPHNSNLILGKLPATNNDMTVLSDETLRYDKMVENALRGVVRDALEEVVKDGLPGDHHFYITFLTDHPGVKIPDYLHERYPGEMTIVLQYQSSDLAVDETNLQVTLSFNNKPEKLIIPLASISIFADPSVNFALQFQPLGELESEDFDFDDEDEDDDDTPPSGGGGGRKPRAKKSSGETGEVVSLDTFRKKK